MGGIQEDVLGVNPDRSSKADVYAPKARLHTLPPPTIASSLRPPTLRTRSTGGLLIAKVASNSENEFDAVEEPSPVLSPGHQGLDGLSESLARLMNQRRHSHTGEEIRADSQLVPTNDSLLGDGAHFFDHRPVLPVTPPEGSDALHSSVFLKPASVTQPKLSPQMAEIGLKSPSKAGTSTISAPMTAMGSNLQVVGGKSALNMLRKASVEQQSGPSSHTATPPESGYSTPRMLQTGKAKPHVLETHHLQLQTHAPSGRRMINQYIIETELGRGVHGKVRLARDTETGEKVAVKIVEREGKKRLGGGGLSSNARAAKEEGFLTKGKEAERKNDAAEASSSHTRFSIPLSVQPKAINGSASPTTTSTRNLPIFNMEKQQESEKALARKRQLWTTDKKVKREIALLKKCAHENVVQLKEVIDDPSSKKIFMVLEFMEGGEVQWKDKRGFPTLTVEEARRTLRDVVLGLEYLHYQGIIHRDIKPANLLWDANRRVKISDFGVSHFSYALLVASGGLPSLDSDEERMKDPSLVDDHELAKTAGSPAFFAPELCLAGEPLNTAASQSSALGRPSKSEDYAEFPWIHPERGSPRSSSRDASETNPKAMRKSRPPITKAIDVWALGVTLYCLLFGHVPFMADNEFALFAAIPREDYELPAYMGADRIQVGPRKRRWTSLPQWTDEEADVDSEHKEESEADVDPASLGEEARLVRDLLDRLLEKDPAKRIKLDEVKKHPWLVRGIANPPQWLSETDPAQLPSVQVSNEEVDGALTGFSKIKQTLKKFQTKLFAGLGVQNHHATERVEQRMQGLVGGTVQRQRSKSTSHVTPLLVLSPQSKAEGVSSQSSGATTPAIIMSTPKHSHLNRPHLFSRRQSTAMDKASVAMMTPPIRSETSHSQPSSRPHSPDPIREEKEAEKGRTLQSGRRPSSFFKRAGSRIDGREGVTALRKQPSTDGVLSNSSHDTSIPRSSLESDPGQWSFVSGSQSGLTTLSASQASRPRSRSRLSDVFRNVLGQNDRGSNHRLRSSRPGTTSSQVAPLSERNSNRSLDTSSALASAGGAGVRLSTSKQEENEEKVSENVNFLSVPVDQVRGQRPVEVDDYDVDLDLSDDDLDDEKGNEEQRSHSILRNSGRGWVMERNESSSSEYGNAGNSSTNLDSLTPSVEGGYNLYKPPYSAMVPVRQHSEELQSYAMAQVHSDEAEALRRASAKEFEGRKAHKESHLNNVESGIHGTLGDLSTSTEDRFADAEEEEEGYDDDNSEIDNEQDDDDGGVSFKARKRAQA